MMSILIGALVGLVGGGAVVYLVLNAAMKKRSDVILKEAEVQAEALKKEKIVQAKEKFLQLKEEATGVVFDQPVLDTLLLSAVVHPNQESHRLEELAARFDVTVLGRHTALGDAMVTAEVFHKMIPLLAEKGIHTLAQAREAAQQTYFARLNY